MIQGEKFKGFGKICYPQIGGVSSPSRPNPEFINSNELKRFLEDSVILIYRGAPFLRCLVGRIDTPNACHLLFIAPRDVTLVRREIWRPKETGKLIYPDKELILPPSDTDVTKLVLQRTITENPAKKDVIIEAGKYYLGTISVEGIEFQNRSIRLGIQTPEQIKSLPYEIWEAKNGIKWP